MLFDVQVPTDAAYGKLNILAGTRSDLVTVPATISTVDGSDAATTQALANAIKVSLNASKLSAQQVNSGALILKSDLSNTLANGDSVKVGSGKFNQSHTFDPAKKITKVQVIMNGYAYEILQIHFYHHKKRLVQVGWNDYAIK